MRQVCLDQRAGVILKGLLIVTLSGCSPVSSRDQAMPPTLFPLGGPAPAVRSSGPIGWIVFALCLVFGIGGCGRRLQQPQLISGPPPNIAELWQDPVDLEQRDLFHGAGESRLAPRDTVFQFVARDSSGWSPGFTVKDANGVEWSVKLGPEAQSEVVTSRVLWAIGFHQPPTYYVEPWSLMGAEGGAQPAGRFRPELPSQQVVGEWSWYENPFVGSQPYGGLVVANLLLNSWDWKASNNKIYELSEPVRGVKRWFVVRDLGASLGRTTYPRLLKWFRLRGFGQGTRNDLPGFEEQGFIRSIDDRSRITFDYRGIYRDVINSVTPTDVRWTCQLLSRLSERQWRDVFRAAEYDEQHATRYIRKIKEKIAQGLALTTPRVLRMSGERGKPHALRMPLTRSDENSGR